MGKLFLVRKSQGILTDWKMREFYPKYWKSNDVLAIFYFSFFSDILIEVYLVNRFLYLLNSSNKTLKNTGKVKEIC